jgi:hypothetical protein
MSLYDYRESQEIDRAQYSFYALIMAAMRQADTENTEKLRMCWPDIYDELFQRYNAPGGAITPDEIEAVQRQYIGRKSQ